MADLTVLEIQKLKPSESYYQVKVSTGLYVGVATNSEKKFITRYSVSGKQLEYRLPKPFGNRSDDGHMSLLDAKAKVAEIRALGKQGIDYQKKKETELAAIAADSVKRAVDDYTVADLFTVWFATTRRKDQGAELTRSFNRDVLPGIGTRRLRELEEGHIRTLLLPISSAGMNRKAVVTLNNLKQMFSWASGRRPWKLLVDDPTANLKPVDITQPGYEEVERDRVLSIDEIKLLATKLPAARLVKTTEFALWLALSCCTRIGETIKAEWAHINLVEGIWFIPEANTKGKAPAHTVYLSRLAVRQFEGLKAVTGDSKWCFPSESGLGHLDVKSPTKQIGDRQASLKAKKPLSNRSKAADSLVLGVEKWTPHDLRRTGATLLQELDVEQHVIERMMNHAEQNRMVRIYQQHSYADQQKVAWERLGQLLSQAISTDDI